MKQKNMNLYEVIMNTSGPRIGKLVYVEHANSVFVMIVIQEEGFDSGEGPVGV